jgi:HlyD family secretion protein
MTKKRLGIAAVLLVVLAAIVWSTTRSKPVEVAVVVAERGTVAASVTNTRAGTVDACRRAGMSPAMGGQIASLPVREGDAVEADQLLLELWNEDMRAELELAQRDAAAARSRAREACVIASVAKREAERLTKLRAQGLSSEEATEKAEGDAEARAAACAAGRDAARVSEARVDVANATLERTRLRAPFPGVIAEINGELGEFVTPSPVGIPTPPTVDLIDDACLYISAPIDEVDAPLVKTGLRARITLDAFPERRFNGHVRRVAPYVLDLEKQARTVEIEAEIDDPDKGRLLPGYSADVEVLLDTREDVIRIPSSVVIDGEKVFVLNETAGVLEERQIEIGLANWEFTEVLSGVDVDDLVVSSIDREGVADQAPARRE